MYDPMYDEQLVLATQNATWDPKYDNPNGDTRALACSGYLYPRYPYLKDAPDFPYIGGSYDIRRSQPHPPNCQKCWKLTNKKTQKSIFFIAIDDAKRGFVFALSKASFIALSGGTVVPPTLEVDSEFVLPMYCAFQS
ncbi:hypothetical protein BGY98DRAFT_376592 [Russula aff. rugulosa BPL654]|nr:hypothetical protein BGY98DRAFT_376592 [Russula aff. rugulosa BPL654]